MLSEASTRRINHCYICDELTDKKEYNLYECPNCNFQTPYCFQCNKSLVKFFHMNYFMCFLCKKFVRTGNKEVIFSRQSVDEDFFRNLFFNREDSSRVNFSSNLPPNNLSNVSPNIFQSTGMNSNFNFPPQNNLQLTHIQSHGINTGSNQLQSVSNFLPLNICTNTNNVSHNPHNFSNINNSIGHINSLGFSINPTLNFNNSGQSGLTYSSNQFENRNLIVPVHLNTGNSDNLREIIENPVQTQLQPVSSLPVFSSSSINNFNQTLLNSSRQSSIKKNSSIKSKVGPDLCKCEDTEEILRIFEAMDKKEERGRMVFTKHINSNEYLGNSNVSNINLNSNVLMPSNDNQNGIVYNSNNLNNITNIANTNLITESERKLNSNSNGMSSRIISLTMNSGNIGNSKSVVNNTNNSNNQSLLISTPHQSKSVNNILVNPINQGNSNLLTVVSSNNSNSNSNLNSNILNYSLLQSKNKSVQNTDITGQFNRPMDLLLRKKENLSVRRETSRIETSIFAGYNKDRPSHKAKSPLPLRTSPRSVNNFLSKTFDESINCSELNHSSVLDPNINNTNINQSINLNSNSILNNSTSLINNSVLNNSTGGHRYL